MFTRVRRRWVGGLVVLALLGTACAGANAASGGGSTFRITAPADGAQVTAPFTIKVDSSVPLGEPSTGRDHVHFCFDGADCSAKYKLTYGNSLQVTTLGPGMHTIEASLRNADHTAAGPTATITVTVVGPGGGGGASAPPPGYGY
jgi:Bacterial Ig domain